MADILSADCGKADKNMKKKIIRAVVLSVAFVAAVILSGIWINRGEADMIVEMESATLPTVSFQSGGYEINRLAGYRQEMRIPAMRDTITPLDKNGDVTLLVQKYGTEPEKLISRLYTLDGSEVLAEEVITDLGESVILHVGPDLKENTEAVLQLILYPKNNEAVYYYTRVIRKTDSDVGECMDFTRNLHESMLAKNEAKVKPYLETDETVVNRTLHEVDIHAKPSQALWGNMNPKVSDTVLWELKESNDTYQSILLKYRVQDKDEADRTEEYLVKEFFKVRKYGKKFYLLDYERMMDRILDATTGFVTVQGIDLGISGADVDYRCTQDGTKTAFVKNGELWCYDKKGDTLSCVFSFRDGADSRGDYDQHDVQIVNMDEKGNLVFMVYGYMNRGIHEGEVGVAVYKYRHDHSTIEEKVFLSSDKAYAVASEELCRLVYYNEDSHSIYLMKDHALIAQSTDGEEKRILAEDLETADYVVSDDGRYVAWKKDNATVETFDFATEQGNTVTAGAKEELCPLAFVGDDLILGYLRTKEKGIGLSGTSLTPMYKLEIRDPQNTVVKTYQESSVMVSDIFVSDRMVTLKRVKKSSGTYRSIGDDYITNHEEQKEQKVQLVSYTTTDRQEQYRLVFDERIQDDSPRLRYPKQVMSDQTTVFDMKSESDADCYYVYGAGEMAGAYDRAGYAVQKADEIEGVVVSANQTYVWERGNYQGWYQIPSLRGRARKSGETTLDVCLKLMLAYEDVEKYDLKGKSPLDVIGAYDIGEPLDLTGCAAEDLRYIIGRGTPVLAMKDGKSACLLIGYRGNIMIYIDPSDGKIKTNTTKAIDEMTEGSGHTYLGYAKAPTYHE